MARLTAIARQALRADAVDVYVVDSVTRILKRYERKDVEGGAAAAAAAAVEGGGSRGGGGADKGPEGGEMSESESESEENSDESDSSDSSEEENEQSSQEEVLAVLPEPTQPQAPWAAHGQGRAQDGAVSPTSSVDELRQKLDELGTRDRRLAQLISDGGLGRPQMRFAVHGA